MTQPENPNPFKTLAGNLSKTLGVLGRLNTNVQKAKVRVQELEAKVKRIEAEIAQASNPPSSGNRLNRLR